MCRKHICFKNATNVLKKWDSERDDMRLQDSWETELDSLFKSYDEVYEEINHESPPEYSSEMWETVSEDLMEELTHYFKTIKECDYDPELFEDVVNDPFIQMFTEVYKLYQINPHKRFIENMFVSKKKYGVVMNKCVGNSLGRMIRV